MTKKIQLAIIIALSCLMAGCATKTTFEMPDGKLFTVKTKSDGVATFTQGDVSMSVDNRGRPTVFESMVGALIEKAPTVQIGGD